VKIIKVKDYHEMSKVASDILLDEIKTKKFINLGLATGSTPIEVYQNMVVDFKANKTDYQHVKTFNLDEYVGLFKEDPNSYHYFMNQHLFSHLPIKKEYIHIPNGVAGDIVEECNRYEILISKFGGIDIQILGIGVNGHIGFNEPGSSFSSKTRQIVLDESTRTVNARFFVSINEVPKYAITMGIGTILKAKKILLLVSGENKKETMRRLLNGDISEDFPASILKTHPNVLVIADESAMNF
jgi:glucosamine-6-phosphate deaminase